MGPLGISLSLIGLGAQAIAGKKSAEENNAIRRKLIERSTSLDNVFNKEYNQDYMQTVGVKNTMAAYAKGLKDVQKDSEGRAAMAGSSPEAVIAGKQAVNENYGDFIRKVASGADAYRADKERAYQYRSDRLNDQIFALDNQKAARWDNLAKNAAGLSMAGISADSMDEGSGTGDWLKNLIKKPSAGITEAYKARGIF